MITFKEKYELFINGEFVEPKSGKYIATYNPANGEKLSEIADASKEDVDLAVSGAKKAFESWKHTSVKERATILRKIADVIEIRASEMPYLFTCTSQCRVCPAEVILVGSTSIATHVDKHVVPLAALCLVARHGITVFAYHSIIIRILI